LAWALNKTIAAAMAAAMARRVACMVALLKSFVRLQRTR
jgi:hypothetical protein